MAKNGFTLLELLLSVVIIVIVFGLTIPVLQSFQSKNDLDVAIVTTAQSLRRAQSLAQASDGDSAWGVYIQSGSITMFKGSTYVGHNSSTDETFTLPSDINPATTTQIIFNKFSGLPTATSIINLTSNNNVTKTITINSKGTVSY